MAEERHLYQQWRNEGNPEPPLPADVVNAIVPEVPQLLPTIRQRIRQAPYINIDSPFHPIRVNVLFIISEPFAAGAELLRERTIRIVGDVILSGNPPEEIPDVQQTVIEILRYLESNRAHPFRASYVDLLHAMIVRDNRIGGHIETLRVISALLNTVLRIPNGAIQNNVIGIFQRLVHPENGNAMQYDEERLIQLQIVNNYLGILFNHPIIVQQPHRQDIQHQFILRLFELFHDPPQQHFMEHVELLYLMLQLLVAPDGFNEQQRARLGELMNGLHQDPAGHAFIQNFENILMEIIANEDVEPEEPEPSITNVSSQSRVELSREQRRGARGIQSAPSRISSQQTRERQLDERMKSTATSKRSRS
jgi:hypothetical protein